MEKVSIIIPVYNVEKYLEQCVVSALNQTLEDIEIICINDGSTDNSLGILNELSEKDKRIRVIDKVNSGYGNTMNIGIDSAHGKYIVFLESDDFILPELCEVLYELCEKYQLDMIKTDYYEFKTKRTNNQVCAQYMKTSWDDTFHYYHKVLNPKENPILFHYAMYTWSCMYSREFLNKYKIRHNETPGASYQDNGFWFQTLMYCEKMFLLNRAFYMYRQDNPNSSIYSKEKVYAFFDEYTFIRNKIDEYNGDKKNKEMFLRLCAFFDLKLNMISLNRVDKKYTEELIGLISKRFEEYVQRKAWNIKELDLDFIKKLMICIAQPDELKKSIWNYIDKDTERKHILEKYDTFIVYGAGLYANELLDSLRQCKLWNKTILCGVTSADKADNQIYGIKIKPIDELLKCSKEALVIVCAKKGSENYQQMCANLEAWNVKDIVYSKDLIVEDFWLC